ncbi:EAL domain-containing response regulator [Methyloversatilis thermotolerans]|uniref:EAL domain-containing response regulator n=1 Tax=Methyloversatilis thermotolerans TaxID=1346290 RepID=UPI0003797451|nr:EAL domain-containing response regulator [Methyloversatilis thermotolerans]
MASEEPPFERVNASGVLVVEDSLPQRMTLVAMLRDLGVHAIEEAAHGQEALHVMQAMDREPAIMLVDLEMPVMDGVELLHRVAAAGYRPEVIISSSREAMLLESVEAMVSELGLTVLATLHKPVTEAALRTALLRYGAAVSEPALRAPRARGHLPEASPQALAQALDEARIVPWFQPKVDLQTAMPRGAEVLARWIECDGSVIEPARFIDVAERCGLMPRLTVAMLASSLVALRKWDSRGLRLSVAINLSPVTFSDRKLADDLIAQVADAGIDASRITFEVTETAMTKGPEALKTLLRLKLNGFALAIDDFGTGFSSMQQLSKVPFSELKIDRSIVHEAWRRPARRTILESAIDMGHRLGMVTVGEGVETLEDWQLLSQLGCDLAQGYFMSPPVSFDEFVPVTTRLHRTLRDRLPTQTDAV